jgi:acyl dehydratase
VVVAVTTPKAAQTADHKAAHGDAMTAKEVRLGATAVPAGTTASAAKH